MTGFIAWLLNTKIGRTVLLVIIVGACWKIFSWHYTDVGYTKCQNEHALAVANDNVKVVDEQNDRDAKTDKISDKAGDAAAAVTKDIATQTEETKGEIHVIYRDRPASKPVAAGSCVHPLDAGVQHRIESAVDKANSAGG